MSVGEAMTNTGYIDSAAAVAAATTRCIINHRCHAFDIHTNTHSRAHTHTLLLLLYVEHADFGQVLLRPTRTMDRPVAAQVIRHRGVCVRVPPYTQLISGKESTHCDLCAS